MATPQDAERLTSIERGEDERLSGAACGERAATQQPRRGAAIKRADLLQDYARACRWCSTSELCHERSALRVLVVAVRCGELRHAPIPLPFNDDEPIAKLRRINSHRVVAITDDERDVAHHALNLAPRSAVGNQDAFASVDERSVTLILERLSGVNVAAHRKVVAVTNQERLAWGYWRNARHQTCRTCACATTATTPDGERDEERTASKKKHAVHSAARFMRAPFQSQDQLIVLRQRCW